MTLVEQNRKISEDERFRMLRNMSKDRIALKLRAYRKEYGFTQDYLARMIGVGRTTVERWENAHSKISNMMIRALMNKGIL